MNGLLLKAGIGNVKSAQNVKKKDNNVIFL